MKREVNAVAGGMNSLSLSAVVTVLALVYLALE